ncbi:Rieske (2Fe-2S) protein [Aestuariimicrobium ganziense]|uniref:Rieske (2Fe-2S) protein n=1 Tax=Aestuariimicrobium ganziense TaxID=2773677 RepID=UPI0019459AE4|nr:Rieske (2Fe-2S) protein [Aestuariimicrobium ganziense]
MTPTDRRQFLTNAGAAAVACCGLAGCSRDEPGQSLPSGDTSASGQGGLTVAKSDVPVGGGRIDTSARVVVVQPEDGEFKAWTSVCPHQGCDVTRVESNVITCECHGSRFSAVDGSVQEGPATQGLTAKQVSVEGDQVVVTG